MPDGTHYIGQSTLASEGLYLAPTQIVRRLDWTRAMEHGGRLSITGNKGWRLLTREEAEQLCRDLPTETLGTLFHDAVYWTSREAADDRNNAYARNFHSGAEQLMPKSCRLNVCIVRAGPVLS